MFWTKKEKAKYLAKEAIKAVKEDRDLEKTILEALEFIEKAEKGSGVSGL